MIYNLTQHHPTPAQEAEGVLSPVPGSRPLLDFATCPDAGEIWARAQRLAQMTREAGAVDGDRVMIGGAPYLMGALERALVEARLEPAYAFSVRDCIETPQADGSVRKEYIFRHAGWVVPFDPPPTYVTRRQQQVERGGVE